ncbi:hypothetical protein HHL17_01285 [Chitinophaga sp. G-6-1-13]|uniref:Carboxypeptidase-like regulatory domain-containing protein n=1 Tax=Chitinophaga fulva TaxID=2728842 RepID=A0A848GCX9_9BACT|nr:carboxypeptidase-like regulatory domain-containing protein [Chitinophaga fulva]NML35816.1 hypothetical protein [Chitinophaga fulva]
MKRTITVSIPKPCHEQWDSMLPGCGGNYCQQCEQTVIDFSLLSDQELLDKLGNSSGNICGRFDISQVGREIHAEGKIHPSILPAFALSTLLSIIFPDVIKAQQVDTTTRVNTPLPCDTSCVPFEFSGRILDAEDRTPVPAVTIKCMGKPGVGTSSSSEGKFRVAIPPGLQHKYPVFEISVIGYERQSILLNGQTGAGPQEIMLKRSVTALNELVVTGVGYTRHTVTMGSICIIRKRSWWQRFWDHFRRHRH